MKTTELKLFEVKKDNSNSLFVEEKQPSPSRTDVYDKLNKFFNEKDHDQVELIEAREILGENANNFTDDQIQDLISNIRYLVGSWVEDFERHIFEGKTFDEVFTPKDKDYAR